VLEDSPIGAGTAGTFGPVRPGILAARWDPSGRTDFAQYRRAEGWDCRCYWWRETVTHREVSGLDGEDDKSSRRAIEDGRESYRVGYPEAMAVADDPCVACQTRRVSVDPSGRCWPAHRRIDDNRQVRVRPSLQQNRRIAGGGHQGYRSSAVSSDGPIPSSRRDGFPRPIRTTRRCLDLMELPVVMDAPP
jgi:hypothetical protein